MLTYSYFMDDLHRIFGENVRKFRTQLKLTQAQLSELIDVSPSFIGYIENGKTYPSFKTIGLLATALKVSPGQLFDREDGSNTRTKNTRLRSSDKETEYNPTIARVIHDLQEVIKKYESEAKILKKSKKAGR